MMKNVRIWYMLGGSKGQSATEVSCTALPPPPPSSPPASTPRPHLNLRYYGISRIASTRYFPHCFYTCEDSFGGTGVVRKIHSGERGPYGGPQIENGFGEDRIS